MLLDVPPSSALLTLWQEADGAWRARIVLPDGQRLEFHSPFELARWSRGAARPPASAMPDPTRGGLR